MIKPKYPAILVAIFLSLSQALTFAATPITPEQLQSFLHKKVDTEYTIAIVPIYVSEPPRKLAHAILDGLWAEAAYRDNMRKWLSNHQNDSADQVTDDWLKQYHRAFHESFEFFDRDTQLVLFRLSAWNAIYDMDRADCSVKSQSEIVQFIQTARDKLFSGNSDKFAVTLPKALTKEYARQNNPRPGDRPISEFMTMIVRSSLNGIANSLPPEDKNRLIQNFSYGRKDVTVQEQCEIYWVTSHAINDSTMNDPEKQVSANLLRSSITASAYSGVFENLDQPLGVSRPTTGGFTPGKKNIYYPKLMIQNRVQGDTSFTVSFDETGTVTDVAIASSTLQPESVTGIDGTVLSTNDLLKQVVDAYFRAGAFTPRVVEGKNMPGSIVIPLKWHIN